MSFPAAFGSQLTAIMEALLKAVVAEVTALVEDGAVELRLELQDRDRQILEKEQDIEERDRVIEELRAAVEELTAPEEAPVTPGVQEETENSQEQEWTKEEETEAIIKSEPNEASTTADADPHESLWPQPTLPPSLPIILTTTTSAACEYDESRNDAKDETTRSYSQHSPEVADFSHFEQDTVPLDSFQNLNQEPFFLAQQTGFPLMPDPALVQDSVRKKSVKKRSINVTTLNYGGFRCDQCGKTFTVKWRLMTHQSVHTGEKPFSCRKCGKKFSRRDNCVRHEKSDVRCIGSPGKG